MGTGILISIHALREEGDQTLRATQDEHIVISIHALREEGDNCPNLYRAYSSQFLSTPSVRRATRFFVLSKLAGIFLSTPSVRRATVYKNNVTMLQ